ncbi:hypothetical protein G9A89_023211 [Geosiphon pyriformis]|nr:hypothetical protein G9A89_023211 [Geosiphon pyriformis]
MAQSLAQLHPRQRNDTEVVNQTQSLTIVKQILKNSLSSITYLRSIFLIPNVQMARNLEGKIFMVLLKLYFKYLLLYRGLFPEENYEDFQVGSLALKQLKRDYSQEANSLLDWLETGIFNALSFHYLRAIIFGIFLDPSQPNKLVECYTFKVTYPKGEPLLQIENNEGKVLTTIGGNRTQRGNTKASTIGEIKKATQQLLRRLILLTQTLKPLPDNRHIVVKLHYYENITPPNYEPPFFRASHEDHERLVFDVKPEKIPVGEVETAFHGINLKIQTISDSFELQEESRLGQNSTNSVLINDDDDDDGDNIIEKKPNGKIWNAERESDNENNETEQGVESRRILKPNIDKLYSPSGIIRIDDDDGEFDNETSNLYMETEVFQNKEKFKLNIRDASLTPEPFQSNSVPTALSNQTSRSEAQRDSQFDNISRMGEGFINNSTTTLLTTNSVEVESTTKTELNLIQEPMSTTIQEKVQEPIVDITISESEDDEVTNITCQCDCASNISDGDMIQCSKCNTWGHVPCYGYKSRHDSRIFRIHTCYRCLHSQGKRDGPGASYLWDLSKLEDLALFRRGLLIVWEEGFPKTSKLFAERLGVKLGLARQIQKRLKTEGFLQQPPKQTAKRGKKSLSRANESNTSLFIVLKSMETKRTMENYFNPLLGVSVPPEQETSSSKGSEPREPTNEANGQIYPLQDSVNNMNSQLLIPPVPQINQTLSELNITPMDISPLQPSTRDYMEENVESRNRASPLQPSYSLIDVDKTHEDQGQLGIIKNNPSPDTVERENTRARKKRKVSISVGHIAVL